MRYFIVCACFEKFIVMASGTLEEMARIKGRTYGASRHYKIVSEQTLRESHWDF